MKYSSLIMLITFLVTGYISTAQKIEGNWKGTSICQIKSSPCHDEIVVYHISKNEGNNLYQVNSSKIIEGKEEEMGILNFSYDSRQKILVSIDNDKKVKWEFKVTDKEMHGTLISNGRLFRIIDLKKDK